MLDQLNPLDGPDGVKETQHRPEAIHPMNQPGVRPLTVTLVTIGGFQSSKQVVMWFLQWIIIPIPHNSGGLNRSMPHLLKVFL